jgi:hypothetical protein
MGQLVPRYDEEDEEDDGMDHFDLGDDFDDKLDAKDADVDIIYGEDAETETEALAALEALFGDADDVEDEADIRRKERAAKRASAPAAVTCARCYSLRNYGKVKNEAAEILMPSFDFGRVVGRVGTFHCTSFCSQNTR